MKVLVLYKALFGKRSLKRSVLSHIEMFEHCDPKPRILYWNIALGTPNFLQNFEPDMVVLHTTLLSVRYGNQSLYHHWRNKLKWLEKSDAVKVLFPQDERYFTNRIVDWANSLGDHTFIYSVFGHDPETMSTLYSNLSSKIELKPCLTGYVDQDEVKVAAIEWSQREVDVFYRAKRLPVWVGRFGRLKSDIGTSLQRLSSQMEMTFDVSLEKKDMLLGASWMQRLRNSKFIVGCEAGGSGYDPAGDVTDFVKKHVQQHNTEPSFQEIDVACGQQWDGHNFKALGPRHFEAAITKTCQILVEGEYSGVLKANEHYIPIASDLHDLEQVLLSLDRQKAEQIAQNAYQDLVLNPKYSYTGFAELVMSKAFPNSRSNRLSDSGASEKKVALSVRFFYLLSWLDDLVPWLIESPNLALLFIRKSVWPKGA